MNLDDRDIVDALAARVAADGHMEFQAMNLFLEQHGVALFGDETLMGEHIGQPQVHENTTLYGPTSEQYVEIVEALFKHWPVRLMIADPASFRTGDEPWHIVWTGAYDPEGSGLSRRPPLNPDVQNIADSAKHGYAVGTCHLARAQFRLAELAGTGQLDPDESYSLQESLIQVWEALYSGTVCAVRDWNTPDSTYDWADNTYNDGRTVLNQRRVEPWETSDNGWVHNRFLLGDGAVGEFPRGTVSSIASVCAQKEVRRLEKPSADPDPEMESLRARLDRHS